MPSYWTRTFFPTFVAGSRGFFGSQYLGYGSVSGSVDKGGRSPNSCFGEKSPEAQQRFRMQGMSVTDGVCRSDPSTTEVIKSPLAKSISSASVWIVFPRPVVGPSVSMSHQVGGLVYIGVFGHDVEQTNRMKRRSNPSNPPRMDRYYAELEL